MADIDELTVAIRRKRRELDEREGARKSLLALKDSHTAEVAGLSTAIVELDKTATLLTSIGEDQQLKAQESIEKLVTEGLQTIFDDTLSFHILQKVSGKNATVEFKVRTALPDNRVVETDVLDARGGGLAAVIGFLLRVVVMLLEQDGQKEKILILDETFAHVSEDYLAPLGEFLKELKNETGVQIILVTHQQEFTDHADKVYRFSIKDGKTIVKEEQ